MNVKEKLMIIQKELKAPKGQFNSFGKYSYRSQEDILEAVKPLLASYNCSILIGDEVIAVGDRVYIKASCKLIDCESDESITTSAFAREPMEKKGMDESQITGTASSYARKYALNGLFAIDDNKDADAIEIPYGELTKKIKKIQSELMKEDYDYREDKELLKGTGLSSHDPSTWTFNDVKGMSTLYSKYDRKYKSLKGSK